MSRWTEFEYVSKQDRLRNLHPELFPSQGMAEGWEPRVVKRANRRPTRREFVGGLRFTGISSVALTWLIQYRWNLGNNLPWNGSAYPQTTQASAVTKTYQLAQSTDNNAAGGADEAFSYQQVILAGASATVDMNAMTNLMSQTSVSIARVKSWMVRLLSLTDDTTISANTNTNSRICITNNGPSVPVPLNYGSGGSGLTLNITNAAGGAINVATINVNGSGYLPNTTFPVTVNLINGAQAVVSINTNAAGIPTAAVITNGGTGYITCANVPTTELGSFWLQTGCAQCLVDATALGSAISNTSKNLRITNLDQSNAVTFELDAAGGTT